MNSLDVLKQLATSLYMNIDYFKFDTLTDNLVVASYDLVGHMGAVTLLVTIDQEKNKYSVEVIGDAINDITGNSVPLIISESLDELLEIDIQQLETSSLLYIAEITRDYMKVKNEFDVLVDFTRKNKKSE